MTAQGLRTRLRAPFVWLSRNKGDDTLGRERGQALVRVLVSAIAAIYLMYAQPFRGWDAGLPPWFVIAVYAVISIGVFWRILSAKESSPVRRFLTNVGDMAVVSHTMIASGEPAMPLFLLYLWITLGNGFRFGSKSLLISAVLGVLGFSVVVYETEIWQIHQAMSTSVFLALVILPAYTAHLLNQLNSALQQAKEASAAKSQFLARMSHELRTPLNGVLGATDLIENGRRVAPEDQALLQVIRDSVQISLSQINNVLDLSKLEAGKLVLESAPFDLHELVNLTARMVRPAATQKALRFHVRIDPAVEYRLVGDPLQLRAVLLNLLTNAVKFTERGYVTLEIQGGEQTLTHERVRFEVHDTGTGIGSDALSRIFDSFAQEDAGTTRRFGGTGLGTTIAKQLVEIMGGRIGVESVKGQGSVFWCEIPFERQRLSPAPQAYPGTRVLLVSQNEQLPRDLERRLAPLGVAIVCVRSRREAVESVERSLRLGNAIHLTLVDVDLAVERPASAPGGLFYDRLIAAGIPYFLISDVAPEAFELRLSGFCAVIARDTDAERWGAIIHSVRAPMEETPTGVVNVPPWMWAERRGERRRLLVADDNKTNLMIVGRILEEAGYQVDAVSSGDEAYELLQKSQYRLAILDMHMPGLDGLAVLRRIRSEPARKHLPVIMLTANVSLDAKRQSADSGADAYLAKPVRATDLLAEIDRLLHESEVESIYTFAGAGRGNVQGAAPEDLVDLSVLSELDRIYRDPQELARTVDAYEREARELFGRLVQACNARNYPAFCDALHAFKGNASNVGAGRLIQLCQEAEVAGVANFLRTRDQLLLSLRKTLDDTVDALRRATTATPGGRERPAPGTHS